MNTEIVLQQPPTATELTCGHKWFGQPIIATIEGKQGRICPGCAKAMVTGHTERVTLRTAE